MVISIDGPAASGKSTTARLLANKLSFKHLNTGIFYRAVTYIFIRDNLFDLNKESMDDFFNNNILDLRGDNLDILFLNNINISDCLSSDSIDKKIHLISNNFLIREQLVSMQRTIALDRNIVCEGRDIGSVVFPDAEFKFFLIADIESRATRRYEEQSKSNPSLLYDDVKQALITRDFNDTTRSNSPLIKPIDSMEVDTTNMTIDMQVNYIYKLIKQDIK
jgi:cytidylate kinase